MIRANTTEDFYLNSEGLLVFTEHYHLKRGSCCGMGCLHCPYEHVNVRDKSKIKSLQKPLDTK